MQTNAGQCGHDVIIIGAGFAGLSAGALLAQRGLRVLLLERAARLGGRATYVERDGFVWQYGQHSHRLAKDGLAARVFDRLGAPLEFIDTHRNPAHLYFQGELYPRPENASQFLFATLLPATARVNFLRFYAKLLRAKPEDWYDKTLTDMYRTWFHNPHVERFLSFLGFTIMLPDPAMVSAGEVIQFVQRASKAAVKQGEPRGGSKQVIDKLESALRAHGAEIHCPEPATAILVENGRAAGVRTALAEYRAPRVVFAAPVSRLFDLIDTTLFAPSFVTYAKSLRASHGVSIDFVFDEPIRGFEGGILGVDLPLWVKFQSAIDPTIAPPGKFVTTWAMLLAPGAPMTEELVEHTTKRIKAVMEHILPGLATKIVRERRLVLPVVNANMLIPSQSFPHRPAIVRPEVPGLYLIGDTTQAEGCSGDIAFASALKLADVL